MSSLDPGTTVQYYDCNTLTAGCAVVPEPATIALLLSGLICLVGISLVERRRA